MALQKVSQTAHQPALVMFLVKGARRSIATDNTLPEGARIDADGEAPVASRSGNEMAHSRRTSMLW